MKDSQIPEKTKILNIVKQNALNNIYTLSMPKTLRKKTKLNFIPGQYLLVSVPGAGEAPFGLASSPYVKSKLDIAVKRVGQLTTAINMKKKNDFMGLRGPFGNGFPLGKMIKKDIVLVAGGTGIAPLSSLVEFLIKDRKKYNKIYLLYGTKIPDELLFKHHFKRWSKKIELCQTVERPIQKWKGKTGLVTSLCSQIIVNPKKTIAIMVGPPIMYKFVIAELKDLKIKKENIYLSLEARLKCGIGKCQHCVIGNNYVCQDGPVFNLKKIEKDLEKL